MLPKITARVQQRNVMQSTTLRGFTGGLNVIDDEMNLNYRYSTELNNCVVNPDGSIEVRQGTQQFGEVPGAAGSIVNMEYFSDVLIVVQTSGDVSQIDASGTTTLITSTLWGATDFVSFAKFNGNLILCNGIDKPLNIDSALVATYLQDLATLTNINTPICKYVVAHNHYLVMAGDPLDPERIHISAKDAPGTWFGDPPPNDATRIEIGGALSSGSVIRGLLSFRDKLLVLYAEGIVIGTLGIYDTTNNHVPTFNDSIEQYGCVSHRSAISRGDDGLFLDLEGVPSIARTTFSGQLHPERASELIDILIRRETSSKTFATLEDRTFAVYDTKNGRYMVFVPNTDDPTTTSETKAFIYSYRPALKLDSWSTFGGWNWTCGCRSLMGIIFFGDAQGKVWRYGSRESPVYSDRKIVPPFGTSAGTPISFQWTTPWLDFGERDKDKNSKYINMDTRSNAGINTPFTINMYVDNRDQPGQTPALSALFQARRDGTDTPARITGYKKLIAWPCKFLVAKFRITGSVTTPVSFIALTLQYQKGSIRR